MEGGDYVMQESVKMVRSQWVGGPNLGGGRWIGLVCVVRR